MNNQKYTIKLTKKQIYTVNNALLANIEELKNYEFSLSTKREAKYTYKLSLKFYHLINKLNIDTIKY